MSAVRIVVLGDIALNGELARLPARQWSVLSPSADSLVAAADVAIYNFEAPVFTGVENTLKRPRLRTSASAIPQLPRAPLTFAVLANNHMYDSLEAGFTATVEALAAQGISCVGAGLNARDAAEPAIEEAGGRTIGILAYNDPSTNPSLPPNVEFTINTLDPDRAEADVRALAARVDIVVVSLHWGIDYLPHPSPSQRTTARRLTDAGAAVVFGHHAHVVQGIEGHGQSVILYGLGNTCFYPEEEIEFYKPHRRSVTALIACDEGAARIERVVLQERTRDGLLAVEASALVHRTHDYLNALLRLPDRVYRYWFAAALLFHQWVFRPVRFLFNDRYTLAEQLGKVSLGRIREHYFPRV